MPFAMLCGQNRARRMSIDLFFVGLNPRWQMYKFLPIGLNVMYSAAGFWDKDRGTWRWGRFPGAGYRWLDMGGFSLLNKYGEYPFTVGNAMNLVARLVPDWYASMDYPCEPEISRRLGLRDNMDRVRATVGIALEMARLEETVPGSQLVPVIQGYTIDEYQRCIDLYAEADLVRPYMAVGSMCKRRSSSQLHVLIPAIFNHARSAGCERLHFFGLKLSPDLFDLSDFIWSRDSAVVMDSYDPVLRAARNGRRWPRGQVEKKEAFMSFLFRVEKIGLRSEFIMPRYLNYEIQKFVRANGEWNGIADCDGTIDHGILMHLLYAEVNGV